MKIFFYFFILFFSFPIGAAKDQTINRIISLSPDITEIIFALHAENKLIATISESDYPRQAQKILRIGNYNGLDIERIVLLKPDLIIAWRYGFKKQIEILRQLKIPVLVIDTQNFADLLHNILQIGTVLNQEQNARLLNRDIKKRWDKLKVQHAKQKKVTVFLQIGASNFFTVNKKSWLSQMLELCSAENVFADVPLIAFRVDFEAIFNKNPELVISDVLKPNNWRTVWLQWPHIKAVKYHNLYALDPDLIERAGPRLILGAEKMCGIIDQARAKIDTI